MGQVTEISVNYLGNLKCQATHTPTGAQITTDAPPDNQGLGTTFSPTDLVATALATCVLTILGIAVERLGLSLLGMTATVTKTMGGPPRHIANLALAISIPCPTTPEQRATMERLAHACPVQRSLSPPRPR